VVHHARTAMIAAHAVTTAAVREDERDRVTDKKAKTPKKPKTAKPKAAKA